MLSYKIEGIGERMFEVDSYARSVTVFRTSCFQGLAAQICLQGNEGIVYWQCVYLVWRASPSTSYTSQDIDRKYHTRMQPMYSTVHEDPPIPLPPCQISYYRFSLLASKHCFFLDSLPLSLPRKSMHNQDDGFTLLVQRFCCTRSLSTAIYTWDDRQVWCMD